MSTGTKATRGKKARRKKKQSRFDSGVNEANWEAWRDHLRDRDQPKPLRDLLGAGRRSPISWALPGDFLQTDAAELIGQLDKLAHAKTGKVANKAARFVVGQLDEWLTASQDRVVHPGGALECLAWAHALPTLAQHLELSAWQSLLETLLAVVRDAEPNTVECPLVGLIVAGELPLTLAYQLPELKECSRLVSTARSVISQGIIDVTDGEGLPHSRHLEIALPLFAAWTRCRYLGREFKKNCFSKEALMHYEWLVRQTFRLLRGDGSLIFSSTSAKTPKRLLRAALKLDGDRADRTIASRICPGVGVASPGLRSAGLPEPSAYSEWSQLGVMRSEWKATAQQFSVRFGNGQIATELSSQKRTLWSGNATPDLLINGVAPGNDLNWREICWFSDEEADYLELEADLLPGWQLQRQFCFGRDDGLLLIADVILGDEDAEIDYALTYPLAKGSEFHPSRETNEGTIAVQKKLCRVFPLAFPEWRMESSPGSLTQTCDGLRFSMSTTGRALYAPLLFDLSAQRQKGPLTWRRLTIAHLLEIESRDQAVGYRVQSRDDQFLIYRSLTPPKNRTLMGQNLAEEFVFARFTNGGALEELIMIE